MESIQITTSSGYIECSNITSLENEVKSSSGNCMFEFNETGSVNFNGKTTSGDITLEFANKLDLNISSNKKVNTDFISNSSSKNKVNLTTSSGKISIN